MSGPLSGLRVLDLSHYGVGPWACVLLGEMGADIVKVEPLDGDYLSRQPPPYKNGITTVYICSNLNKRIAQFDLHDETVRETMYELVRQSDIVVENHRPGYYDRRGMGWETVQKVNPRIIYCSSSGYGSKGPYKDMGSTDPYGQAIGAFASVSGDIGAIPEGMKGTSPMDHAASQYIVSGVLAAVYNRTLTGRGQFVDTSQMHAAAGMASPRSSEYFASGVSPVPMGSGTGPIVPTRAYQANDKKWVNLSALDEPTWQRLCAALGLTSLATDTRLQTNAGRVEHRAEVDGAIEGVIATESSEHWIGKLQAAGVPSGGYWIMNQLRISEQVREQRMLEEVDTQWGKVTVGGMPWRFSRTPGHIIPTHKPGADNEEIMRVFAPKDGTPPPVDVPKTDPIEGGPLRGLKVVDLTTGYEGFTGSTMGDLGAMVVKVEPPDGDPMRQLGPPFIGKDAASFAAVNRSKQSVCLDWENDAAARESLDKLIAGADVLITDYQPTAARERRIDWATLEAKYPKLVHCSITPFGDSGPMADQPATDLEIQGISSQYKWLGDYGGAPVRMGVPIGPTFAAIFAFHGIMAALYERTESGRGQRVSVSQLASQLSMQSTMWTSESEPDDWGGHAALHLGPRARGYATADRAILWGFGRDEAALKTFCERLGIPEIMDTYTDGMGWQKTTQAAFEKAFEKHGADELVGWVRELGGSAVPYHTFATLAEDPQALALGMISSYDYPGVGKVGTINVAWEFSDTPATHGRPPLLGEHTDEVLAKLK